MKFRLITFCILASAFLSVMTAEARGQGAPPPPPPQSEAAMKAGRGAVSAPIGGPPMDKATPQLRMVQKAISAYADKQCAGKSGDAADECRETALWDAAKCTLNPAKADANDPASQSTAEVSVDAQCAKAAGPSQFEYEVASIKPNKDNNGGRGGTIIGNGGDFYRGTNMSLQNMVMTAYNTGLEMEVKDMPDWARSDRYDVDAKMTPEVADLLRKLSADDRGLATKLMMRALVQDRLNLKAHLETKEVPTYDLVIGKNGPKLGTPDPNAKDNNRMSMMPDPDHPGAVLMTAKGVELSFLTRNLANMAGRPVFDKTGLTGTFDFTISIARDQAAGRGEGGGAAASGPGGSAAPSAPDPGAGGNNVMDAVATLGLKLVPSRGPKNVLVIEHIDKPDAN